MNKTSTESLEKLIELSALLISTLELDPLLTKILQTADELMDAEASNVMLLDSAKNELYYEVVLGTAGSKIQEQKRIKVGTGIAGWVAEFKKPLLVNDAYSDPRFFSGFDKKTGFKTRNILCLPLTVRGKLIGVAQIINKRGPSDFAPADQDLFSKYCAIAAVAIDNALMQKKMLEQDRLQRDMQLAEEIQRTFLPKKSPMLKNLRVEYRSMPCRYVGGDLIDLQSLPEGRLSVLLGDVSGKGVPAALFGAKVTSDFEHLLAQLHTGDQMMGPLMTRLNNMVVERSTRGMFVTCTHACFDSNNGQVELVNAGHLAPLLLGPGPGQIQLVECDGFPPLGVIADLSFTVTKLAMVPGQTLLLMTDGVTEAKSNSGERLGVSAVEEAVKTNPDLAVSHLMNLLTSFTANEVLADDITLIAVSYGQHTQLEMSSDSSSLAVARRFIEEATKQVPFTERVRNQIAVAVTEALANIIKHTFQMKVDGRIQISVHTRPSSIQIHIRDWGPKQDPTQFKSRDIDHVRPGGIGVHFMQELMDVIEYDVSNSDGNELHMCKILHAENKINSGEI